MKTKISFSWENDIHFKKEFEETIEKIRMENKNISYAEAVELCFARMIDAGVKWKDEI